MPNEWDRIATGKVVVINGWQGQRFAASWINRDMMRRNVAALKDLVDLRIASGVAYVDLGHDVIGIVGT